MDRFNFDKLKNEPSGSCNLKYKVNKLDLGKLFTTRVDLSKLSVVIIIDLIKETQYNKLVEKLNKINATDTSDLVKKLTATQKLMKLKRKLLILIMLNILLLKNLIN